MLGTDELLTDVFLWPHSLAGLANESRSDTFLAGSSKLIAVKNCVHFVSDDERKYTIAVTIMCVGGVNRKRNIYFLPKTTKLFASKMDQNLTNEQKVRRKLPTCWNVCGLLKPKYHAKPGIQSETCVKKKCWDKCTEPKIH